MGAQEEGGKSHQLRWLGRMTGCGDVKEGIKLPPHPPNTLPTAPWVCRDRCNLLKGLHTVVTNVQVVLLDADTLFIGWAFPFNAALPKMKGRVIIIRIQQGNNVQKGEGKVGK